MNDERQQTGPEYDVYLDIDDSADVDVESPIHTARIDYYDSGIWVDRDTGRTFLPYDRILLIEERPASESGGGGEAELAAESATESNAPVADEQDLE
jgi:hypothetical protein